MNDSTIHAISGLSAGIVAAAVVSPLDIVKFKLQNQLQGKYHGTLGTLKLVLKEEGIRGLYRGISTTIQVYSIDRTLWFPIYHYLKGLFPDILNISKNHLLVNLSASTVSSAIVLFITHPLWLIRTRILVHDNQQGKIFAYRSLFHGFNSVLKMEGWKSLYKGLIPSFIGISHVAVQFPLYERLKLSQEVPTSAGLLFASSTSKLVATCFTYPHEVVRTRLQMQIGLFNTKYTGLWQTTRLILKEEGIGGLYKGLGANLLRTVPAAAISIYTYEILVMLMQSKYF